MCNNVTNKQLVEALRVKTLASINSFDPVENNTQELLNLSSIVLGLINHAPSFSDKQENEK